LRKRPAIRPTGDRRINMRTMEYSGPTQIVTIGIAPGELLLESITEALKKHDIENGVVISGIGALKRCKMHSVEHTEFPPKDVFYTVEKPLQLQSVSGIVAAYKPHLHVVVSWGENGVWGGHLEEDCEVSYVAEIAVLKCNGLRMTRTLDEKRKLRLLGPEG